MERGIVKPHGASQRGKHLGIRSRIAHWWDDRPHAT
jgi:hypothetical protein